MTLCHRPRTRCDAHSSVKVDYSILPCGLGRTHLGLMGALGLHSFTLFDGMSKWAGALRTLVLGTRCGWPPPHVPKILEAMACAGVAEALMWITVEETAALELSMFLFGERNGRACRIPHYDRSAPPRCLRECLLSVHKYAHGRACRHPPARCM